MNLSQLLFLSLGFIGLIAIFLILKFKKIIGFGFKLSNLIVLKICLRLLTLICFFVLLKSHFLTNSSLFSNKELQSCRFIYYSSDLRDKIDLTQKMKDNMLRIIEQSSFDYVELINQVNQNTQITLIPSTRSIEFISLISKQDIRFKNRIDFIDKQVTKNTKVVFLNKSADTPIIDPKSNWDLVSIININNWFLLPFMKVYLLILLCLLLSLDIILKFILIKS